MDEVILARHGESELSVVGIVNGDPTLPCALTAAGREQAQRLGDLLADTELDLCVTSEFERVRETADLALAGRHVPHVVLVGLNDVRFGGFEGSTLAEYREWAGANEPTTAAPGGGESRAATITRYVSAYRTILSRPEPTILVVTHGLPIRYILNALDDRPPEPLVDRVPYAEPYLLSARELDGAVTLLEAWGLRPMWVL
jgi:broad specificity phosphatase PhoE